MQHTRELLGALIGAALLIAPRPAAAQDEGMAPLVSPVLFLDRSYFALGTPTGKNLRFEGIAAGHYFVLNQLSDERWQNQSGKVRFAVPVTMTSNVRMLRTESEPVRTPSYRIGVLGQAVLLRRSGDRTYSFYGLQSGFIHYSNGQEGCTYLGYARPHPDSACAPSSLPLASRRITNTRDGDFSTSYFPLAFNYRHGVLYAPRSPMKWQVTLGGELQIHPIGIPMGGVNTEQTYTWGQHQVSGHAEWERHRWSDDGSVRRPGVFRVRTELVRRFGGIANKTLTGFTLEPAYVFDNAHAFGFFARWHLGFDYYNIQYQDHRPFIALGLTWDPGRLDQLAKRLD